jgi:hypothetical protein
VRASERASRSGNKEGDKRARRAVVIYDDESKREREGERARERERKRSQPPASTGSSKTPFYPQR